MAFELEETTVDTNQVAADKPKASARRAGPPRLTPIYVLHKRKVPMLTFELALDGLTPLAARALQRLPRHEGVPVVRGIGKEDDTGFVFQFRVAPRELTAEAVPALLERWDEKFEVAKAKAGLTPAPAAEPEALRPRAPRRARPGAAGEEGGTAAALVSAVADIGIVHSAITAHDAQLLSSLLSTSAAPPSIDGGELTDAVPDETRDGGEQAGEHAADVVPRVCDPTLLGMVHVEFEGDSAGAEPDDWRAWTHATLLIAENGLPSLQLRQYALEGLDADPELLVEAAESQARAAGWKVRAEAALTESLDVCLRMLATPERLEIMRAAIAHVPQLGALLDVLLLDMQLSRQLTAAIDKQQVGMAGWALAVRQHLVASARAHERFHAAGSPAVALELVDRWAGVLTPMRLTQQAGLFAEAPATHLQRQLNHLVEHSRAWCKARRKDNARDESARVLAVWATWARALPELTRPVTKKAVRTLLNRPPPGSD